MSKKESTKATSVAREGRQYRPPIFNVTAAGKTIEWTDKLSEATAAYRTASLPKYIWSINGSSVQCVNRQL
jgi:hypothetical protein